MSLALSSNSEYQPNFFGLCVTLYPEKQKVSLYVNKTSPQSLIICVIVFH